MTESDRVTADQAVNVQSLDLIGQLLNRSRRWEFVGAIMLLFATFSAGGIFVTVRGQFQMILDNQEAVKQQLTALTDTNARQDEAIRGMSDIQKYESVADRDRDKAVSEIHITQRRVVELLNRVASDLPKFENSRIGPN